MIDLDAFERLNPRAMRTPIFALRIGVKTQLIAKSGYPTLEELIPQMLTGGSALLRIPSVGRSTVSLIEKRVEAVRAAITINGEIDWDEFARAAGFPLVPDRDVENGSEFLAVFESVISEIIAAQGSDVDRLILSERLAKPREQQKTLQEIADLVGGLSRERIRQREAKLLGELSSALLYDDYEEMEIQFRSSFSAYWKTAAASFGDQTSVTLEGFITGLAQAWEVSAEQLLSHIPLVISILTSSSQIPVALRPRPGLDQRFYRGIAPTVSAKPIERLALRKFVEDLRALQIDTIGQLIEAAKWNRLPTGRVGQVVDRVLAALAMGLRDDGSIDWQEYSRYLELVILPSHDAADADAFITHLREDLEAILRRNGQSIRAADIFAQRTGWAQDRRPTLAQLAETMKSHGPSIKREETILLATLHEQLVDRDFTESSVYFRSDFLRRWREAHEMYEQSGKNFDRFCSLAVSQWGVSRSTIDGCGAGLWAVLNRYPHGRQMSPRGSRKIVEAQIAGSGGGLIVLRGFRRVH